MSRTSLLSLIGCVGFCLCLCSAALAETHRFQHEHVLGSSCEIDVSATTYQQAKLIEATVLSEIDRLQQVFSAYDSGSELMRWQRGELADDRLSAELINVLARAEFWRAATGGAFDVRAGELGKVWKQAAQRNQLPDATALKQLVDKFHNPPYSVNDVRSVTRRDSYALSLDAIAKGYILDSACERVMRKHQDCFADKAPCSVSVMIGGDMRRVGSSAQKVSIANPFDAGESSRALGTIELHGSVGLATSGGYRRYYEIDGARFSHIIDPRSGQAATSLAGVTVIAPTGMDADAAATSVAVLGPVEGLKLIDSLDGYAALLVLNSGDVITSMGWDKFQVQAPPARPTYVNLMVNADDKDKSGLLVKFTLGSASGGGRYHRPYVAVWLEDKDGFPVKTAVLWLQTTGPGPRWHRDLTKWYSNDQMRRLVDQKELIGTISGATRGAGEYETRFDGTDNDGKPLKPGKYALCLEAAREHGTHQFVREAIEWSDKPIAKKELKAGTEFSAVSYRFVPSTAEKSKAQ